jgi:ubiquinone/menaquinone biosynthesis C-methylase UbiE
MDTWHASHYTEVDSAADPAALAACMDVVANCGGIDAGRRLVADRLMLGPGAALLDLGCGTGDQTRDLAARVLPGGRAVGMDLSQTMIGVARQRSAGTDLPVEFETGDAQKLRFDDDTFDACRTERMLIHVPDARAALAEMVRVTRPGGRVGIIDADIESIIFNSTDRPLTRRIVASFADSFQNGWIGRQLAGLMTEAGLVALNVEPYVMLFHTEVSATIIDPHLAVMVANGDIAAEAAGRWRAQVFDDALSPVAMTMYTAVGEKA